MNRAPTPSNNTHPEIHNPNTHKGEDPESMLHDPDETNESEGDESFYDASEAPSHEPSQAPPIELSDEQQNILEAVMRGESLFFTGSAGNPSGST